MLKKRISRLYAVQILYQLHFVNQNALEAVDTFLKYYKNKSLSSADPELVKSLVLSAHNNELEIKDMIDSCLCKYKWEDLELIISLILRIAISEMKNYPKIDAKVIISEYMIVASSFFENRKIGIINAILQNVANIIRPDECLEHKEN